MGTKFRVRSSLGLFLTEFSLFRILSSKFSETYQRSTAELMCFVNSENDNIIVTCFLNKVVEIFSAYPLPLTWAKAS